MKFNLDSKLKYKIKLTGKLVLLIYIILILISVEYRYACPGLDLSHAFGINYFANKHLIFGKDVIWTYGPLGFLVRPVNIGYNLEIAVFFQLMLWLIFSGFIIYFVLKNYFAASQLFLLALFISLSKMQFPTMVDYFICFLVIFLLSLSIFRKKWHVFYVLALLFSVLLWFIKFHSAFIATASVISFCLTVAFIDIQKSLKAMMLAVIFMPLAFVVSYLSYNPSFANMLLYLRGIYEISSGYNVSSVEGSNIQLILVLILIATYFLLMFILLRFRQRSFFISLMSILPLFLAFKRGFVRQDNHVLSFFGFFLFIIGFIFLFTDIKIIIQKARPAAFLIILVIILVSLCPYRFPPAAGYSDILSGIYNLKGAIRPDTVKIVTNRCLQRAKLPSDLLSEIGNQSVTIFPFELSYIAANNLNYKPLPVFQTYSAYTPFLDFLNSQYLEHGDSTPKFLFMEWKAIDGRHPLIDVPATWLSIYRWYDIKEKSKNLLILKRRIVPRFNNLEFIEKKECNKVDLIAVPPTDGPVILKLKMKLNFMGGIAKIFFRIPEIRMELFMRFGYTVNFRVIPDTLVNGLFINFLPLELDGVCTLINNQKSRYITDRFKIYGKGLNLYKDKVMVEFYKIKDIKIELDKI